MTECASGAARSLETCEVLLTPDNADPNELWFRQAAETLVDDGEVSPGAFAPTADDGTSGARSSKTTAREAYELRMPKTTGTYAVEFRVIWSFPEIRLIDDTACPEPENYKRPPGHTMIEWSGMTRNPSRCRRDVRELLAAAVNDRGRVFP